MLFRKILVPLLFIPLILLSKEGAKVSEIVLAPGQNCPYTEKKEYGTPWISASFVFWQTKMGGLEYVVKDQNVPPPNATLLDADTFVPDFAWKPGVQVNLGYNLPYDGWDINARWIFAQGDLTNIKKNIDSSIAPVGIGLIPLWFYYFFDATPSSSPRYAHANGTWKMQTNILNWELGRASLLNSMLNLRLHTGIKVAWIRQYYKAEYENGNAVLGSTVRLIDSAITMKNNCWGIGPRVGFNSKWAMLWGWNLIADASFSLMQSFFSLSRDQIDTINTSVIEFRTLRLKENFSQIKPVAQFVFGLDWGHCFGTKTRYFLGFTLAYEITYWWGQNQLRRFVDDVHIAQNINNRGDMQMQGLTFTTKWEF